MVITAIPAGFAAGLFGIGGGLITVPILFYIFGAAGIEPEYLMHLAVGTSFAIIIPTSIVSVLTHKKHNAVDINIIKNYGFFVPKEGAEGKLAVVNGKLSIDTLSVAQLKHYAQDAGKSEEEISLIDKQEITMSFLAEGVIIMN